MLGTVPGVLIDPWPGDLVDISRRPQFAVSFARDETAAGERVMQMPKFSPRMDILPDAQRRLWGELSAVPDEFTLYGGTALALHLGHRKSVDFDFFGSRAIDVPSLENEIPFLAGSKVIQRAKNTLSVLVDRGGPVQVSFFGVPKLPRLAPPVIASDNG